MNRGPKQRANRSQVSHASFAQVNQAVLARGRAAMSQRRDSQLGRASDAHQSIDKLRLMPGGAR